MRLHITVLLARNTISVQTQILNPILNSIEQELNRFLIIFEQFHVHL
jgi:hypothetical protein